MKSFINNLFSKEKINVGRQCEVDLLRGMALLIVCICHAGLFLATDSNAAVYYFSDIIGSEPAAPVFLILMGLSVIYSRKQSAFALFKRGLILFIGSYLLNLMRSFPYWIVGELDYFACKAGFFVVDILQLAGLTFLAFSFFKKIKMPSWLIFIISFIFLIIGQILMTYPETLEFSTGATYILNLFLPIDNIWCCFNFLTWFIYPCFGLMLGELLIRCKDKNKFYLILLIVGSIGFIALALNIILRFPNYPEYYYGNNYIRMGILNSIITILFVCFLLSLWYFISKILPKFIKNYLTFISKNITKCYVASWVLVSTLIHIQAYNSIVFPNIVLVGFMLITIIFASTTVLLYNKIIIFIKNNFNQ